MINGLALHKLLPALVMPTAVTLWLCLLALLKKRRWPTAVAAALLAITGAPATADWLLGTLEGPFRKTVPSSGFEAVFVLGGYLEPWRGKELEPQWNEAGDRLEIGIRMIQEGRACKLVISAGGLESGWSEGKRALAVARARGIPADQLILTGPVRNTADEAVAIATLAKERGWKRIALVTSAFHMQRALFQMEMAGLKVTPVPTDFHSGRVRGGIEAWIPSGDALRKSEMALREWLGIAYYALNAVMARFGIVASAGPA